MSQRFLRDRLSLPGVSSADPSCPAPSPSGLLAGTSAGQLGHEGELGSALFSGFPPTARIWLVEGRLAHPRDAIPATERLGKHDFSQDAWRSSCSKEWGWGDSRFRSRLLSLKAAGEALPGDPAGVSFIPLSTPSPGAGKAPPHVSSSSGEGPDCNPCPATSPTPSVSEH